MANLDTTLTSSGVATTAFRSVPVPVATWNAVGSSTAAFVSGAIPTTTLTAIGKAQASWAADVVVYAGPVYKDASLASFGSSVAAFVPGFSGRSKLSVSLGMALTLSASVRSPYNIAAEIKVP